MVTRSVVDFEGGRLSMLRASAVDPRGLVIALHGGGHDARYWHHPAAPDASLLTLGAALGFDVVAIDRPGHNGSLPDFPAGLSLPGQIDLLFALIDHLTVERRMPVFLIGHSLGGTLSLIAAADSRGQGLAGIEVGGVPIRFTPEQEQGIRAGLAATRAAGETLMPDMGPDGLRAMFFGPDGSFDPAVIDDDPMPHRSVVLEIEELLDVPPQLPDIAARIACPVRWTFAELERSSVVTPETPAEASRWLTASIEPRPYVCLGSGHNMSLHHVGRAYHLGALAFFEEMRARHFH